MSHYVTLVDWNKVEKVKCGDEFFTPFWVTSPKSQQQKQMKLSTFKKVIKTALHAANIVSTEGQVRHAGVSMAMSAGAATEKVRGHTLHTSDDMIRKHYFRHVDRLGPPPKTRSDSMSYYLRAGFESRQKYFEDMANESNSESSESDE